MPPFQGAASASNAEAICPSPPFKVPLQPPRLRRSVHPLPFKVQLQAPRPRWFAPMEGTACLSLSKTWTWAERRATTDASVQGGRAPPLEPRSGHLQDSGAGTLEVKLFSPTTTPSCWPRRIPAGLRGAMFGWSPGVGPRGYCGEPLPGRAFQRLFRNRVLSHHASTHQCP